MEHKQLELLALYPYTSEQPTKIISEEKQIEETWQSVKYEQLELELFPQQPHEASLELMRLAASLLMGAEN